MRLGGTCVEALRHGDLQGRGSKCFNALKHSCYDIYIPPNLTFIKSVFFPQSVCVVYYSKKPAILNLLASVTGTKCVFCELGTEFLNTVRMIFRLQMFTETTWLMLCR
jgi:hypothetical protein